MKEEGGLVVVGEEVSGLLVVVTIHTPIQSQKQPPIQPLI